MRLPSVQLNEHIKSGGWVIHACTQDQQSLGAVNPPLSCPRYSQAASATSLGSFPE